MAAGRSEWAVLLSNAPAAVVSAVFVILAAWHFKMAFFGMSGERNAVPSVDGKPLFEPSKGAAVAVGVVVLLLFAALVAATAGFFATGLPQFLLAWACYALALGLFARAIGEFNYVGFFKNVRGSKFARMGCIIEVWSLHGTRRRTVRTEASTAFRSKKRQRFAEIRLRARSRIPTIRAQNYAS